MKNWKVIREEYGDIIKYELTKNIYIERNIDNGLDGNHYTCILVVDKKDIKSKVAGTGYRLNDLKNNMKNIFSKGV